MDCSELNAPASRRLRNWIAARTEVGRMRGCKLEKRLHSYLWAVFQARVWQDWERGRGISLGDEGWGVFGLGWEIGMCLINRYVFLCIDEVKQAKAEPLTLKPSHSNI